MTAAGGKVFASLDAPTSSLYIGTSNDIVVTASNNITETAGSTMTLNNTAGAGIVMAPTQQMSYTGISHNWKNMDGTSVIYAQSNLVKINADVEVFGTINSIHYTASNLTVMDKVIALAWDSNDTPVTDGPVNNQSGISVAGSDGAYDRSMLWYVNGGRNNLGTSNVDQESYWELKGGQFRLSASNQVIGDVNFGFRINQLGELEIVKRTNGAGFKRIAKFGRTIM